MMETSGGDVDTRYLPTLTPADDRMSVIKLISWLTTQWINKGEEMNAGNIKEQV